MRQRLPAFFALAACLAAPALYAVDLKLPPEVTGEAGEFVKVAADTDGETVRWYAVDPGLNLFPVELLKDTKTAVVTARAAGRYRILAYTAKDGELSEPVVSTVVIGNAPPVPPPGPDLTGLAKVVYDAAKAQGEPATAAAFAENFGSVASSIAAGAYDAKPLAEAKQSIFSDLAGANRATAQANPDWQPFMRTVSKELGDRDAAGQYPTAKAIGVSLSEIVSGLEAAAR